MSTIVGKYTDRKGKRHTVYRGIHGGTFYVDYSTPRLRHIYLTRSQIRNSTIYGKHPTSHRGRKTFKTNCHKCGNTFTSDIRQRKSIAPIRCPKCHTIVAG